MSVRQPDDFVNVLACRGLSSATGGRVTFLLRGQEKSNQKRRPPRLALAGHSATAPALLYLGHPCPRHARKVREVRPGFSTGLLS